MKIRLSLQMKFSDIIIISNNASASVSSNNTNVIFAGFLGAFIVDCLGVKLVRTQKAVVAENKLTLINILQKLQNDDDVREAAKKSFKK